MNFRHFCKCIWPTQKKEEDLNPENIFEKYSNSLKDIEGQDNVTLSSKLFELSKYLFDGQAERRNVIENRATSYFNATALLSGIIIILATLSLEGRGVPNNLLIYIILFSLFLALLFLVRAIVIALGIFGEIKTYCLGPDDLIPINSESKEAYMKRVSVRYLKYTIENYKINNRLNSKAITVHACIRNAIILLATIGILLALYLLIFQGSEAISTLSVLGL